MEETKLEITTNLDLYLIACSVEVVVNLGSLELYKQGILQIDVLQIYLILRFSNVKLVHTAKKERMVRAWYMDEDSGDQRKPHMTSPAEFVSIDTLKSIGVNYWLIDADNFATSAELAEIRRVNNYDYEDQVTVNREKLPNYDEMIGKFFQEHIHTDDETRLCADGSGYFDVRDPRNDHWIRIEVVKNDMISIPPGLYHRFTVDEKDFIVAKRYFCGSPVWTPLNRPQDDHPARIQYLKSVQAAC